MSQVTVRIPAGDDAVWSDEGAASLVGQTFALEVGEQRGVGVILTAHVDEHDPGFAILTIRAPDSVTDLL